MDKRTLLLEMDSQAAAAVARGRAAMLTGQIAGEPAAEVARRAALFSGERGISCLGLNEALKAAGARAGTAEWPMAGANAS